MSLNSALLAGVSGLTANSGAMAAISDNIANVNTTGYKRSISAFDPLVKANSNGLTYNAGGTTVTSRQLVTQQGLLASSSSSTDMGISGTGFFVVSTAAGGLQPTDVPLFTRSGSFAPDQDGNLRNTAGYYLQGWPVQVDGTVATSPSDISALETVNIGAIGGTAEASTQLQLNANLQSTTAISAAAAAAASGGAGAYNATTNNMASGAVTADFTSAVQLFDSKGSLRTVTFSFLKQDPSVNPNGWYVEAHVTPASDVTTSLNNGQVMVGDVAFTSDGAFDAASSTLPTPLELNLGASGSGAAIRWDDSLGVSAQDVALDFGGPASTGGLTQLDSPSSVISTAVNGSVFGDLAGVQVDPEGFVIARFNNGVVKQVYKLPVATFINANGLEAETGGAYRLTGESGQFTMKEAGNGGAGLISPQSLESSNVDLATEFTGLITTQRAYSAASKIITTADEMLEELIRMKR